MDRYLDGRSAVAPLQHQALARASGGGARERELCESESGGERRGKGRRDQRIFAGRQKGEMRTTPTRRCSGSQARRARLIDTFRAQSVWPVVVAARPVHVHGRPRLADQPANGASVMALLFFVRPFVRSSVLSFFFLFSLSVHPPGILFYLFFPGLFASILPAHRQWTAVRTTTDGYRTCLVGKTRRPALALSPAL